MNKWLIFRLVKNYSHKHRKHSKHSKYNTIAAEISRFMHSTVKLINASKVKDIASHRKYIVTFMYVTSFARAKLAEFCSRRERLSRNPAEGPYKDVEDSSSRCS